MARHPAITSRLAANTIGSLAERMRHMDDWVVELLAHKPADPRVPEWNELRRAYSTAGSCNRPQIAAAA